MGRFFLHLDAVKEYSGLCWKLQHGLCGPDGRSAEHVIYLVSRKMVFGHRDRAKMGKATVCPCGTVIVSASLSSRRSARLPSPDHSGRDQGGGLAGEEGGVLPELRSRSADTRRARGQVGPATHAVLLRVFIFLIF